MPLCIPESPDFTTGSERLVWERLRDGLGPGDLLVANLRVTDEAKDHELDLLVGLRGHGVGRRGGQGRRRPAPWRRLAADVDRKAGRSAPSTRWTRRATASTPYAASSRRTRPGRKVIGPASCGPTPSCCRTAMCRRTSRHRSARAGRWSTGPSCPTSSRRSGRSSTVSRAAAGRRTATTSRCSRTCSGRAACRPRTCSASPSSTRTTSSA